MKTFYRYHPLIGVFLDVITFDDRVPETNYVPESDTDTPQRPSIAPVTDPEVPFSTTQAPPKTHAGEAAFFENGKWVVKSILPPKSTAAGKQESTARGS